MSVIKQNWASYSELKSEYKRSLASVNESQQTNLSALRAKLAMQGLKVGDAGYDTQISTMTAEHMKAQKDITDAQTQLESGAIKDVLRDPYWDESYGAAIIKQYAGIEDELRRAAEGYNPESDDGFMDSSTGNPYYTTDLAEGARAKYKNLASTLQRTETETSYESGYRTESYTKVSYGDYTQKQYDIIKDYASRDTLGSMEDFYSAKYGAYTRPEDEIRAEKSATSIAQARGASGGQRSYSKLKANAARGAASQIGGNIFLGASGAGDIGAASGWWA